MALGSFGSRRALRLAAVCAAALAVPIAAGAQDDTASNPTITVSGSGEVSVAPDIATMTIGVEAEAPTAREALGQAAASATAVVDRLREAGIPERSIQTSALAVSPRYPSRGSSYSTSDDIMFVAINRLTVQTTDLQALGTLVDAAVADGANSVSGPVFGRANDGEATAEARRLAVADARLAAETLAAAAGLSLGRIRAIEARSGSRPVPNARFAASEAASPVAAGLVTISAEVRIVWALEDAE